MRATVLLLLGILLALALVAGVALMVDLEPRDGSVASSGLVPEKMELTEEPTEAFANALHDCSAAILEGDTLGTVECFAPSLQANLFPVEAGALQEEFRWILRHDWPLDPRPAERSRDEVLKSLEGFLDHFEEVEDLRLKVKESEASADGRSVEGKLKIWLIGRDAEGRREWVRGAAEATARLDDAGRWRMEALHLHDFGSMVAGRDLFREVAAGAGMEATDPPVLGHPTKGLAAHGAATADVDGDGFLDLFSTGHAGNALYLSNGDGTFREVAEEVFVKTLPTPGAGPLFLDHDNDGDVDLFISTFGEQYLFENRLVPDGRLAFRDISREAQVDRHAVGFSAVAGDVNGDGFPDIYVASYNNYGQVIPDRWEAATNGTPNLLFVNQGDGTFREEAEARGVADTRWGYAAAFADVDGDADLDLYAANDFGGGNSLFINEGGKFIERHRAGRRTGCARSGLRHGSQLRRLRQRRRSGSPRHQDVLHRRAPYPGPAQQQRDAVAGPARRAGVGQCPLPEHRRRCFPERDRGGGTVRRGLGLGRRVRRLRQRRMGGSPHTQRLSLRKIPSRHVKPLLAPGRGVPGAQAGG